jgi:predicted Zn finger-like uncharacterized protein
VRFSCDKCSARFNIADEKVRGRIVAVKCSKCGNRITVNGKSLVLQEEVVEERTRVASLTDMEAIRANLESVAPAPAPKPAAPRSVISTADAIADGWHAIIDRQQLGPLSGAEIKSHITQGKLTSRTYVWRDGQGDWKRAADIPALATALAPKPVAPAPARRTGSFQPVPKNGAHATVEPARPAQPIQQPARPQPVQAIQQPAEEEERPTIARSDPDIAALQALSQQLDEGNEPTGGLDEPSAPRGRASQADPNQFPPADDYSPSASTSEGLSLPQMEAQAQAPQVNDVATGPEQIAPQAADNKDLNSLLFDDAQDMLPTQVGKPIDLASELAGDLDGKAFPPPGGEGDPFHQLPDSPHISKPNEIGEQTRFFMNKAGVNRRNPPWKIALFIVLLFGLLVAALYGLSLFNVGFLQVPVVVDEQGQEVKASVFTQEGFKSLRDSLMGKPKPKPPPKTPSPKPPPKIEPKKTDDGPLVVKPNIDMGSTMTPEQRKQMEEIAKGLGEKNTPKVDPRMLEDKLHTVDGKAGLDEKAIAEGFQKNLSAFKGCIENELKRNPQFKGGKVNITFTIAPSGTVIKAAIDKPDVDKSDLGGCLKEKAKRMVFPRFEGEAFEVESPLVLAASN